MVRKRLPLHGDASSFNGIFPTTSERAIKAAAHVLLRGGIVAFPTETVYGLGVRYGDKSAHTRLRRIKGRSEKKPFQYLLASKTAAVKMCPSMSPLARKLGAAFWPGAMTMVVRTGNGRWLGLRVPDHPVPRSLARRIGGVLVATSANLSGESPAHTAAEVLASLGGGVDLLLDGGRVKLGDPSTVIRVEGRQWWLLREGAISWHDMAKVAGAPPSQERSDV